MIIGTRTLFVETPDGEREVPIRVYMPMPVEPYNPVEPVWACRYEVDWPKGTHGFQMQGNDALDALYAAFEKLGMDAYSSHYHQQRKMRWLKGWIGYGFPLPKGAREELIGHDQQYLGTDEKR